MAAFTDKSLLRETSPRSPAMAWAGALFIAWKGDGNDHLSVCSSTDYGRTFGDKYIATEDSPESPALCVHNGVLVMAWKGGGNHLNVATVTLDGSRATGLANKVVLAETSPLGPSLASVGGRLYLAWKGDGNDHLNVMSSGDGGRTFGPKYTSTENSHVGPAVAEHNGSLVVAWRGSDNTKLNVATAVLAGPAVTGLANKVTLGDASPLSPAIASFGGNLYLGWRGDGNENLNVSCSADGGRTFVDRYTSPETSRNAPALCAYGRILAYAWTGDKDDQLNVAQAANTLLAGTARPKYQVLTVVYAPPGTSGGKSASSVDYGTGSSTGTTTSISDAFKAGVDVTASVGVSVGIASLSVSSDFNYAKTKTDTHSLDIRKSKSYDLKVSGPDRDGIDHDLDQYYIWLNPLLDLTIDPENNVAWAVAVDGPTMLVQYAYGAWLRDPSKMPPGVKRQLDAAGLTAADYAAILSVNPFAAGPAAVDPNRYLLTAQSFPYIPPFTATDPVPTQTFNQQSVTTATQAHSTQVQYGVGITVSASVSFFVTASLKVSTTFQWTNTSSLTDTTGSTQSATVTVGGPAFGYAGPTDVLVYWDTIYNSFLFAFATDPPAASGVILDPTGTPAAHAPVTLDVGGRTLSTFTDAAGAYRFYGDAAGAGQVSVAGKAFPVTVGRGLATANLRLTP